MTAQQISRLFIRCGLIMGAGLFFLGCEIDSSESSSRNVGIQVSGYYSRPEGGRMVTKNTGSAITTMEVRQDGDRLEMVDNNGRIYRGSIGQASDSSASFTVEGSTTAGAEATAAGTITVSGSVGTMQGTWIETDIYGTIYGKGTVPTNTVEEEVVVDTLTITPSKVVIEVTSTNDLDRSDQLFTVSGGTEPYNYSVSDPDLGQTSNESGATVYYKAYDNMVGKNVLTVKSDDDQSATVDIVQE